MLLSPLEPILVAHFNIFNYSLDLVVAMVKFVVLLFQVLLTQHLVDGNLENLHNQYGKNIAQEKFCDSDYGNLAVCNC